MDSHSIRDYRPEDRATVRQICFDTGMMGRSIAPQYGDFESFADMFTAYYTDVEPENSVVAEIDGKVAGYMLCSLDERKAKGPVHYMIKHALLRAACFRPSTFRFYVRSVLDTLKDISQGASATKIDFDRYPSAPHINLLAPARRSGAATEMFYHVFDHIVSRGSVGMHGSVQASNQAIGNLVQKLGFHLEGSPYPVPGLRGPQGERLSLQIVARSLKNWKVGAWKQAGFEVQSSF